MKILIGVPCMDSIKTRTAFSLFNLIRPEGTELVMELGADVAKNRNKIVQYAFQKDFTHILFVDSDMSFPPNTLEKLIAMDVDVVGCRYNKRKLPLELVASSLSREVDWVGMGVMLIKKEVFDKLKKPYFYFTYTDYVSEDVNFCRDVQLAGMKIILEPEIEVRHVGEFQY